VIGLLIFATIADLLVAVVLITVSGFIFGGGPEGENGDAGSAALWILALIACFAAPIGGFALRRHNRAGAGAALAWLPCVAALILAFS
jgi:hypothetical protein